MPEVFANSRPSRSLVIKVLTEKADERTVQDFITQTVGLLYPVPDGPTANDMPCCVVGATVNVSNEMLADDNELMVFCCYRAWGETANDLIANSREDSWVVTAEISNSNTHLMDPELIAGTFRQAELPAGIKIIGVSGVSEKYGSKVWKEIISERRLWMGGEGGGEDIHPMSLYDDEYNAVYYTSECSSLFQWVE